MMLPSRLLLCAVTVAALATPVLGQSRVEPDDSALLEEQQQQQQQQEQQLEQARQRAQAFQPGKVAESAVGRAGQRQTREDVEPHLRPMERISTRIENRIQSRISNRIDRDYDLQANAKSPFATAEDNERQSGR